MSKEKLILFPHFFELIDSSGHRKKNTNVEGSNSFSRTFYDYFSSCIILSI